MDSQEAGKPFQDAGAAGYGTAKRQKSSAGAAFSPRIHPRPPYPSNAHLLKDIFISVTRQPLLLACLTKAIYPVYLSIMKSLKARGWSERAMFVLGMCSVHSGTYVIWNTFFLLCDKFGWLQEYKLARKKSQIPSDKLFNRTLAEAFLGQVIVAPIGLWQGYKIYEYMGLKSHVSQLRSFTDLIRFYSLAKLANSVLFYIVHRAFHHKAIYKYFHKQHHEYTGSIGVSAEYAHPVEQIFANIGPTLLMSLLSCSNPLSTYVWLWARLQETYEGHSGYSFANTFLHKIGLTNASQAAFHDFHHTTNKGNFGDAWLDHIFGTSDYWQNIGGEEGYLNLAEQAREAQKLEKET